MRKTRKQQEKPTGAVLYCRVSSKDQLQNFSIETQERICREYCKQKGFTVLRVFSEAKSAKSAEGRPEFQAMLRYCRKHQGQVAAVVVYAVSRFARNAGDHLAARQQLRRHGVFLHSATEPIDQTPVGKLNETVMAPYAEWANDIRRQRTIDGMKAAIAKGRWVHQPPIGYVRKVNGAEGNLEPDDEKAPPDSTCI